MGEHIAIEMNHAALPPGIGQVIGDALDKSAAGIRDDQSNVQNSFLNLEGMRDGSVTVVEMAGGEVIASMDTLKNDGLNPNVIVLLPEWSGSDGHGEKQAAPSLPRRGFI